LLPQVVWGMVRQIELRGMFMNGFARDPALKRGQTITGRWERNSYKIVRLLGKGGSGFVYLAESEYGDLRAMKVSSDLAGITHEHRMLLFINRSGVRNRTGVVPRIYELDDFQSGQAVYHYIITDYCEGVNIGRYRRTIPAGDVEGIGKQVAVFLACLHESGVIFGDLKPGNIIYDFGTQTVHIVDYGSVRIKGQSFNQYTPVYDRASWRSGSRKADEQYDIFSLGMLMTVLALGKTGVDHKNGLPSVICRISKKLRHLPLKKVILKALNQEYTDCREMVEELTEIIKITQKHGRGTGRSGGNRENSVFVSLAGAVSLISGILGIVYYYQ